MKKRILCFLLVFAFIQSMMVPETAKAADDDTNLVGKITIYSDYMPEQTEWNAVLHHDKLILMSTYDIADMTGVSITPTTDGFDLYRSGYRVHIDVKKCKADIFLDTIKKQPYGSAKFPLEYIDTVKIEEEDEVVVPLEQVLYLLNAQWKCINGGVYVFSPAETLWNIIDEHQKMTSNLPVKSELLGTKTSEYVSNSFMFAVLSFGNEIDATTFVPFIGANGEKIEEELLSLSVPCNNIETDLKTQTEQNLERFISCTDVASDIIKYSLKLTDGPDAFTELMSFSKMSPACKSLNTLDSFAFAVTTGIETATDMIEMLSGVMRTTQWSENYVKQLQFLSLAKDNRYPDYMIPLNLHAKNLYNQYSDTFQQMTLDGSVILAKNTASFFANLTPPGQVMAAYNFVETTLEHNSDTVAKAMEAGDDAVNAVDLCDVSGLMSYQYKNLYYGIGNEKVTESYLDQLRVVGSLLMSAASHGYDAMYSVMSAMNKDTSGIKGKLIRDAVYVMRFAESSQFDPSLILTQDFRNLYDNTVGATREEIPPEYVRCGIPVTFFSCIGEYDGTYYTIRDVSKSEKATPAAEMLKLLPVKPAQYDYICSFAFYQGKLYYCCKESGTSEFNSAIYCCNPDGSDLELIHDNQMKTNLNFLISNNRIYLATAEGDYYDIMTKEFGKDSNFKMPDPYERFNHSAKYFVQEGIWECPYEIAASGKVKYKDNNQIISKSWIQCRIVYASEELLFYDYIASDQFDGLGCYNLSTGEITFLDGHQSAGSGWYFNW